MSLTNAQGYIDPESMAGKRLPTRGSTRPDRDTRRGHTAPVPGQYFSPPVHYFSPPVDVHMRTTCPIKPLPSLLAPRLDR